MKKWNLEKVNKQTTHTAACLYTSHIKMDQNVYSNGYTAYNSGIFKFWMGNEKICTTHIWCGRMGPLPLIEKKINLNFAKKGEEKKWSNRKRKKISD